MDDVLEWLLQPDPSNPGVRYFALKDLLDRPDSDPEVQAGQAALMQSGPVPASFSISVVMPRPSRPWNSSAQSSRPTSRTSSSG